MDRILLALVFAGATFALIMSVWDAWHGRIRTESGYIEKETIKKAPHLFGRLITLNVVMAVLVWIVVLVLLIWLW
jgi:hypothetical protein